MVLIMRRSRWVGHPRRTQNEKVLKKNNVALKALPCCLVT